MKNAAKKVESSRIQLFLRIKHPEIRPDEITNTLKIDPEHATQAGASVSDKGVKRIHSESYWLAALPTPTIKELTSWVAPPSMYEPGETTPSARASLLRRAHTAGFYDIQLILWLKKLDAHVDFIKRLVETGGTITLVLQRPNRDAPFSMGPSLARRLADLEIALEVD